MNFAQLKTYTLGILDDPNGTYFVPNQLNVWLNNALKETQKKLILAGQNFYIKCVTTPTVINQRDYVLPEDFEHLHRLEIITSGTAPNEQKYSLSPMTLNQEDMIPGVTTGSPAWYYLKQDRIVLRPAPNIAQTMRLYYSYEAADMILDTDIPDCPEYFHEFIGILAAWDGFLKDQRDTKLISEKREYYEAMLKQNANERLFDQPRNIVSTDVFMDSNFLW